MTALFDDLLGQTRAVALLEASLVKGRLAPAYLFAGPDGVGRRLAALRFLEGVLAGLQGDAGIRRRLQEGNHPDLLWVEPTYQDKGQLVPASKAEELGLARRAAPQLRLEQIRDVSRFLSRRAVEARGCVVVLEDAEAMAEGAANALLKTLEEPGEGLLILIAATPEQLLTTIRSRCQQIPFTRLSSEQLTVVLERCGEPAPTADPPELLELAAGSPGALLRCRQAWAALPEGLAARLLDLAAAAEPLQALALARDLAEALDAEQQLWLLGWWQLALWRRQAPVAQLQRLERLRSQLRAYVQPRLAWEVALLELAGI
ncbi:DNA polymerase III subunit delta' [Cyanobium sp. T1G-Tous]|uniref:DNA polymerase III subunit delta' n=1 Tax=unclassified Cyanobium TaxID=2627006 RepID=UPI0020CD15DB|nr:MULTISPECIES: DNA polymerase III subunit delta' [unclassified Cyanobium]MCP9776804.1 DNA polymerase III subunit delta' [Cyanobium sp. Tous-M-B4]MCP9803022.1 DNA polymerase III subunit delta' [Cyanobium sp. T1G-Tous]MCP9876650.1 DNA polymerase III subunit delta' [Cyanobium sp. A2C-AMD]